MEFPLGAETVPGAVPVAAGGIGNSEGTVVLSLGGEAAQIEQAISLVKSVKGEPQVGRPSDRVDTAAAELNYDASAQRQKLLRPTPSPSP